MASKIKRITVSNLKAVSSLTADFNGCTAIITGRNNAGKSSFLKSLMDRIRGFKPETILKHDEKEGFYEMELTTGEKFNWTFTAKGEKLLFTTEKNIKSSVTRDIAEFYFPKVFDVDKFLSQGPSDQKKTLQKLTGIDFTEIEKLWQDAYDQRTFFNKQLKIEQAKAEVVDEKLPLEEVSLEGLTKELAGIDLHNMKSETVSKGIADKTGQVNIINEEIAALENKRIELQERKRKLELEIEAGGQWMESEKNKPKPGTKSELELKIAEVRRQNSDILENNKAIEQQRKIEKAEDDAKYWDSEVKRIEAEKLDVIKNASMPEGFGFSDDGITYNGFEFTKQQLSSSGIYIAALKLAAINLGEVKTLHFDASFLDKNSLTEIEKWAEANLLQLLIERPDWEGREIEYQLICPLESATLVK